MRNYTHNGLLKWLCDVVYVYTACVQRPLPILTSNFQLNQKLIFEVFLRLFMFASFAREIREVVFFFFLFN